MKDKCISMADFRKESMADIIFKSIVENYRIGKVGENYYKYSIDFYNATFATTISDEKIMECVNNSISIMEALKNARKHGLTKKEFNVALNLVIKDGKPDIFMGHVAIWARFFKPEIAKIMPGFLDKYDSFVIFIDTVIYYPIWMQCVVFTYQMWMENPDDEYVYEDCLLFLTKGLMHRYQKREKEKTSELNKIK